MQGRPRTGITYDKANEFCTNRGDWITMIDYLEYCALQALCYIEYANFDNQAALNTNLTSDGFKQGGLGAGVTDLTWDRWTAFNGNNPIVQTYWTAEHNIGNGSTNGDHNWKRGNDGQDTDKAVRVLLLGGSANSGSGAGPGHFISHWVRSDFGAHVGFFTTVKLD